MQKVKHTKINAWEMESKQKENILSISEEREINLKVYDVFPTASVSLRPGDEHQLILTLKDVYPELKIGDVFYLDLKKHSTQLITAYYWIN